MVKIYLESKDSSLFMRENDAPAKLFKGRLNMIYELGKRKPIIAPDAYVAPGAVLVGDVILGPESSVWCNAVIRADNTTVTIGARCNIQDGAVLHVDPGVPLALGDNVSVGHLAMLHGCTVGENSLIGIKAVVLNHAVIGKNCLIGANALITENKVIPDGSLVMGSPGRVVRPLSAEEMNGLKANAESYVRRSKLFRAELHPAPSSNT
jgi:carbonic anhydrase/acetyltransferase-like protein (isoleucine patch superfamily)